MGPAVVLFAVTGVALPAPPAAAGDSKRGAALFRKHCEVCHSLAPEYHKEGPSLYRIYGRTAGTVPFFNRYKGLKGLDVVWTKETLDPWLADPRAFLGGRDTRMTLKLAGAEARADIIAFLEGND